MPEPKLEDILARLFLGGQTKEAVEAGQGVRPDYGLAGSQVRSEMNPQETTIDPEVAAGMSTEDYRQRVGTQLANVLMSAFNPVTGAGALGEGSASKGIVPYPQPASKNSIVAEGATPGWMKTAASRARPGLGFSNRDPDTQKGFAQQRYRYELPVKVTWPDGDVHTDVIKGLNKAHALERAKFNWEGATVEPMDEEGGKVLANTIGSKRR